jgi:hypothetical protein
MIYRLQGFFDVVNSPTPFSKFPISRQQDVSLSQSSCVSPVELTVRRGGGGRGDGGGAKAYDGEKAWSSIYHSIPN